MDLRALPLTETISGFSFVAAPDEIAAMDLLVGPTRPMLPGKRGGRRVMVRDCVHPHRYQIGFLDMLVAAISHETPNPSMDLVANDGAVALYRVPPKVVDILSTLTPDRAEFVGPAIQSIADRAMQFRDVQNHYQRGGVCTAVHMLRGEALKAVPRGSGKEVYYWCYQTRTADRLRSLNG